MRRTMTGSLLALAMVVVALPAWAVSVELDPTFSGNGKAVLGERPAVAGAVIAHAGMVYVGGWHKANDKSRPFVARLDDSGDLDLNFSGDGMASVQKPDAVLKGSGLAVDSADRVLLVTQSGQEIQVVRFTGAGELDASFSSDGRRTLRAKSPVRFSSPAVVTDSKDRLVIAAMVDEVVGSKVRVWRLLASGALDPSWSGDGVKTVNKAKKAFDWMDGLTVDQQDRVLLGSDVNGMSAAKVFRFRENGSPDTSFAKNGIASFRFGKKEATWPLAIGVDGSGYITIAATSSESTYGAARLKPDGSKDLSYGDHGILGVRCAAPRNSRTCQPWAADVDDGRVAVQLTFFSYNDGDHSTARISASGKQFSVEWYPLSQRRVNAIAIDGARTLLAVSGGRRSQALVARLG